MIKILYLLRQMIQINLKRKKDSQFLRHIILFAMESL